MSHEIDTSTGRAAFAFIGKTAWHGLGYQLPEWNALAQEIADGKWPGCETPMDVWARASGLDFHVDLAPVAVKPNGQWHEADDYRATVRNDTGKVFEIVSPGYKVFQPREALEFIQGCVEACGMQIETAGALFEGARIFVLAKNDKTITIKGDDIIRPYLLCSTSFDRSMANRFAPTAIRVVCNNTMNASLSADKRCVSIPHSTTVNPDNVKRQLGLVDDTFAKYEEAMHRLAEHKPDRQSVDDLLTTWFGKRANDDKPLTRENLTPQSSNTIATVEHCIVSSPGSNLDSSRGTSYGVLQGVTAFVNHEMRAQSADQRFHNAQFGRGDKIMFNAMSDLLKIACEKTHVGLLNDVLEQTTGSMH